ncbi:copper chaperone PCu(A)C [Marinobacter sp. 1Y8]
MKRIRFTCAALVIGVLGSSGVFAHGHGAAVKVSHSWARPTPPVKPVHGAAYLTLTNTSDEAMVLTGVTTPVTDNASIHETQKVDGSLRMEKLSGGLDIEPGQTVTFTPGGYHIMLMNMPEPLVEGAAFPITLEFKGGSAVQADVQVGDGPAMGGDSMEGHSMKGHTMEGHTMAHEQ